MRRHLLLVFVGIFVLWSAAGAAVSLTVNGIHDDMLPLKTGQTVLFEIRSDDACVYEAYAGFDEGTLPLGTVHHHLDYSEAGSLAGISPVASPPLYGYYVSAAGTNPAPVPGRHFRFAYTAEEIGQTTLKLYDNTRSIVLDSIAITVESAETGTAFTYQGRLLDGNKAADGLYDIVFSLVDAPSEGGKLAAPIELENVKVEDGYFAVTLDFGDTFGANACWLQTAIRPGDSTGDFTTLTPRQRITTAPAAVYAEKTDWNNVINMPAGFADGIDHTGLSVESDPTVPAFLKDGLSWAEILGIPAGFADGTDDIGAGDNLGSHTASQNIRLNGYYLSGDGGNEGVSVAANGNVGIGTASPNQKLSVTGIVESTSGGFKFPDGTVQASAAADPGNVYFTVKRDSGYTWPGGWTTVDFSSGSSVWENAGNAYSTAANRFTAPAAGIYTFNGAINFQNLRAGDLIYCQIEAGGKCYPGDWLYASGTAQIVTASITVYLAQNATASLYGFAATNPPATVYGNASTGYAFTYFSGARVK